ncbi:hypothetical protein Tco_0121259 [Tanacetum coccineum]
MNTKFAKSSILGKPVLQPHRNQSVVRQPTAFKFKRPRISKPWFASQVDVNNDLSKPVTTHYLPKKRESIVVKPHHVIASSESRNSSKNMPRFSSNDMVHNHYLEEAKKKTQESSRNSRPSVMPSARSQSIANGSKPKPRINNQKSRNWPASKSSCVPTGKIFTSSTTKVDSEPKNGSNENITNQYECEQTLDVSAGTLNLSAGILIFDEQAMTSDHNSSELRIHDHNNVPSNSKVVPKVVPPADKTATSRQEVNSTSRESSSKTDERIDKLAYQISTLVEIVTKKVVTPATVKAVEESCVICGDDHAYYNCPTTNSNQSSVCAATGTYNQIAPPNRASNHMAPPGFAPMQNNGKNRIQNQHFQVPNNQVQQGIPNEFSCYMKASESIMRNMQSQINELRGNFSKQGESLRRNLNNDMRSILGSFFQNQASTLGTLSSNTIPNPKGEMKTMTTRSGVAYEGPSIPTNPSPKKVVERETEETIDKEQTNFQGSTAHIQPPVIPILEPDVLKTLPKPNIPYPSRLNQENLHEKSNAQMMKFLEIFQKIHFDISFADALLYMPNILPLIDDEDFNPEGDIFLIEKLLNEDPFQLPPIDLKQVEVTKAKYSIEEPPELELKDLPSHLEYVYLEGNDKLPVIISKSLKDDEIEAS